MKRLEKLMQIKRNDSKIINRAEDHFLNRIEIVNRKIENDIINIVNRYTEENKLTKLDYEVALHVKPQLDRILTDSGYYDEVGEFIYNYQDVIQGIEKSYSLFNYKLEFNALDVRTLTQLQSNDAVYFQHLGERYTDDMFNVLYQSTLYKQPIGQAVSIISSSISDLSLKKYAYTYTNTSIQRFYRTVGMIGAEKTGWERFVYMGPSDKLTRPFCIKLLGKVYTKEQIMNMDNGQIGGKGGVFTFGGGYNCRHDWTAVPPWFKK